LPDHPKWGWLGRLQRPFIEVTRSIDGMFNTDFSQYYWMLLLRKRWPPEALFQGTAAVASSRHDALWEGESDNTISGLDTLECAFSEVSLYKVRKL